MRPSNYFWNNDRTCVGAFSLPATVTATIPYNCDCNLTNKNSEALAAGTIDAGWSCWKCRREVLQSIISCTLCEQRHLASFSVIQMIVCWVITARFRQLEEMKNYLGGGVNVVRQNGMKSLAVLSTEPRSCSRERVKLKCKL